MGILDEIMGDKRFFVCDGTVIKNLEELEDYLKKMSYEDYNYHVSDEKNDFSNWIKDVIFDEELAELIRDKSKTVASIIIRKKIDKFKRLTGNKCRYLSPIMECMIGGEGAANCLDPFIHHGCKFRLKNK